MADNKLLFRVLTLILVLGTQLRQQFYYFLVDGFQIADLDRNKTLTVQTNYFIAIWLVLWIIWRNTPEKEKKLSGLYKGGLTVYATLVMLAYHVLLSSTDATYYTFVNFSQHYILPILFIVDWILFEKTRYQWKYVAIWAIYPLLYAGFALTNGILGFSSGFVYGFLDPNNESGWTGVFTMIVAILIFYIILAILYIWINRSFITSSEEITD